MKVIAFLIVGLFAYATYLEIPKADIRTKNSATVETIGVAMGDTEVIAYIDNLANLTAYSGLESVIYLKGRMTDGDGGQGVFVWKLSDLSKEVKNDTAQGVYVSKRTDKTGKTGAWVRQYSGAVSPEWFGAIGKGTDADDSAAIVAAFRFSPNVYAKGDYGINSTIIWPTAYGWSLRGDKGVTKLRALSDIGILTPPANSHGQFGMIDGVIFSSVVAGEGTGIVGTTSSYIGHLSVSNCDFRNSLKFGIDGNLINSDIYGNKFGYDDIGRVVFSAIKSRGVIGANESNANRIRYNEITKCNGDNAILATGGFHLVLEGNTLENNVTTGPVIRTDIVNTYFYKNWFEGNGNVATVSFFTTLSNVSVSNVFEGNIFNAKKQSAPCFFDITDMVGSKSLVLRNNLFAGCSKIVKNGLMYDELSVISERVNNFVVTGDGSASPYSPSSIIDGGGWDIGFRGPVRIEGALSIGGDVSISGKLSSQLANEIDNVESATPTVAFTFPLLKVPSAYLVSAIAHKMDVNNFGAFAVVMVDSSGTSMVTKFPESSNGAIMEITMSGLDLVITQTSGKTMNDITVSAVRIL